MGWESLSDFYVGDRATSFSEFPEYKEYTRVSLYYDSETLKATVGNDTGREMVLVSPFFPISTSACETLAQNILNELSGFNYRPFKATGAELDPSADLGDTLTICGIESFIGQLDTTFNQAFISDINNGKYFFDSTETYPLYRYRISNDIYDALIEDLEKPELTFKELANKYNLGESTIKKFNYGTL